MREVDSDAVLSGSDDLPDAVLVRRIQLWERRTLYAAVSGVNVPSARICRTHSCIMTIVAYLSATKNRSFELICFILILRGVISAKLIVAPILDALLF